MSFIILPMSQMSQSRKRDLTINEAAERLGVNRKTINRWIESGLLPNAYPVNPTNPRSRRRIPEVDVIAIETQRQQN